MKYVLGGLCLLLLNHGVIHAQSLDERLQAEDPAQLAEAARTLGDPHRGSIIFHQPYMACRKCHQSEEQSTQLGPSLVHWPKEKPSDLNLVESVLKPSKVIRSGFQPLTVITTDGKSLLGLLAKESPTELVLRDPARGGKEIRLAKEEIEEQVPSKLSIMPPGQVNLLASRQQFLDLIRYLIEIRDGGPRRERELQPPPSLFATRPLPEYEKHIDHAGMIADLDRDALGRALHPPLLPSPRSPPSSSLSARSVHHVPDPDAWLWHDGGANLDGAAAKVRRHPFHS